MTEQKEWWSPAEIRFSRHQVIFIIEHLEEMKVGLYPPDHKVTGYSGKKKGGLNKRAYFDNPVVIAAEVSRRLKLTKTDGKLLKEQVQRIAAQGRTAEFEELEPEAQMALNYISLFDFRKRPSYYVFKKNSLYYRDKRRLKLRPFSLKRK